MLLLKVGQVKVAMLSMTMSGPTSFGHWLSCSLLVTPVRGRMMSIPLERLEPIWMEFEVRLAPNKINPKVNSSSIALTHLSLPRAMSVSSRSPTMHVFSALSENSSIKKGSNQDPPLPTFTALLPHALSIEAMMGPAPGIKRPSIPTESIISIHSFIHSL